MMEKIKEEKITMIAKSLQDVSIEEREDAIIDNLLIEDYDDFQIGNMYDAIQDYSVE